MIAIDGARQPDALAGAIGWINALLTGSLATSLAILAIAGVGFAMLGGSISVRQGGRVILGCFLLFGANFIAHGLMGIGGKAASPENALPVSPTVAPHRPPAPQFDPYAGATVPG